ncbi:hypothetical protein OAM69_06830, partial [bacterium]|nr:hypothetical protein [bacterium]
MPATSNMPVSFTTRPTSIAVLLTCLSSGVATAQEAPPPTSSAAYYTMEGSGSTSSALNPEATSRDNPLVSDLRLPTSCEIWDHREDLGAYVLELIEDYIEDKIGDGDKLIGQLVVAVAAAAELAVVAALERALPSLYDFMTQINTGLEG